MNDSGQNLSETRSFVESTWGSVKIALWGCAAALAFGLAVLIMSVAAVRATTDPVTVRVEYYLPYPGVLPDSPLYKLKAVRDRVQLWLTFDEVRRAERELLYADKRIGAAQALAEGGKMGLGLSTATKAEKYLESAINRVNRLSRAGRDVKSMMLTLEKAIVKHREILQSRPEFGPALNVNKGLRVVEPL